VTRKGKCATKTSKLTLTRAAEVGRSICPASRRQETRLELPVGEPDLEALRSVTREWLVPLLVKEFMRERDIELPARVKGAAEEHKFQNTGNSSGKSSCSEHGSKR